MSKASIRKRKRQRQRHALRAKQVAKPTGRVSSAGLISGLAGLSLRSEAFSKALTEVLAESQSQ
jgi:hypothetical protein